MNSRDTSAWANRAKPSHLHSLRWRLSGPSSLSGAVLACSAGPLSSSAAPPLWTVTAWHLLPLGSYHICTGQHLNKEHQELAEPEGSACGSAVLQSTAELLLAGPEGKDRLGAGTLVTCLKSSNTLICTFTNRDEYWGIP